MPTPEEINRSMSAMQEGARPTSHVVASSKMAIDEQTGKTIRNNSPRKSKQAKKTARKKERSKKFFDNL